MIYRSERPLPPRGSTAWGAQQFLRVLDEEERIAAERERLLAMGWYPPQTKIEADTDDQFLGQAFNTYTDQFERDRAARRAVEEEARRRARVRLDAEAPRYPDADYPGGAYGSTPGWVGGGRFGVPIPPRSTMGGSKPAGPLIDDAAPALQYVANPTPNSGNLVAAFFAITTALALAQNFMPRTQEEWESHQRRVQALQLAYQRLTHQMAQALSQEEMAKLEKAAQFKFDALPVERPDPPRDFDPEEARKLRQELERPNANIPPVIDNPPESFPIEESKIPTIFSGPDPSNPPQFPIWMEHRGSSATQWKTTEYARRTVELGRQNDQELEHSRGGYDEFGEPKREEWYSNKEAGGGTRWSNYVDSTIHDKGTGRRILLQTIDTKADGLTPSSREWLSNLRLMYNKKSGDYLVLVPKEVPLNEVDWDAFDAAMRPIVHEIGRPMNRGQRGTTFHPDQEWTLIDVRRMIK